MKINTEFNPIKISIVIETQEEFDSILHLAKNEGMATQVVETFYPHTKYNALLAKDFLKGVYNALKR